MYSGAPLGIFFTGYKTIVVGDDDGDDDDDDGDDDDDDDGGDDGGDDSVQHTRV